MSFDIWVIWPSLPIKFANYSILRDVERKGKHEWLSCSMIFTRQCQRRLKLQRRAGLAGERRDTALGGTPLSAGHRSRRPTSPWRSVYCCRGAFVAAVARRNLLTKPLSAEHRSRRVGAHGESALSAGFRISASQLWSSNIGESALVFELYRWVSSALRISVRQLTVSRCPALFFELEVQGKPSRFQSSKFTWLDLNLHVAG